jgi:hypothetical protein
VAPFRAAVEYLVFLLWVAVLAVVLWRAIMPHWQPLADGRVEAQSGV